MDLEKLRGKATGAMTAEEKAALPDYDRAARGLVYDPAIYDAYWFTNLVWQHPWCHKLMGWTAGEYGPFASSLDLGAGDGFYSHVLAEMGAEPAVAVEVSEEAVQVMTEKVQGIVHDLREPLDLGRGFDLILCLEMAEHLPLSAADVLCDSIALHCSNRLVFTAAPPGQGGLGHCNLQPFSFWADRLVARGVMFDPYETHRMKVAWKNILGDYMPWLSNNVSMFRRR